MFKNNKKIQALYIVGSALLLISLAYFSYSYMARAQVSSLKDSDYDGLSDQAEANVYHTDPLKADTDGDGYLDSTEVLIGSNPLDSHDPADALAAQSVQTAPAPVSNISSVPWYVARAAGIVSYLLMFFIVALGVGMTTTYIYKYINPVTAWMTHKYLSLALGIALLTHITGLLLDKFIGFGFKDVLIPFASYYRPTLLSLGIFGFYILLIIIFTSLFFRLKYHRTWRGVHYFVYLLFVLGLIHGLFIGTDSNTLAMKIVYYSTGLVFIYLVIYRLSSWYNKKRSLKKVI